MTAHASLCVQSPPTSAVPCGAGFFGRLRLVAKQPQCVCAFVALAVWGAEADGLRANLFEEVQCAGPCSWLPPLLTPQAQLLFCDMHGFDSLRRDAATSEA